MKFFKISQIFPVILAVALSVFVSSVLNHFLNINSTKALLSSHANSEPCPTQRPPLGNRNIQSISGLSQETTIRSIQMPAKDSRGFRFNAKANGRIDLDRPAGVCAWLVFQSSDKVLEINQPLPKDGEYIIQLSTLGSQVEGSIGLSLKNYPLKTSIANSAEDEITQPAGSRPENSSGLDLEFDWRKDIGISGLVNIACTLILAMFGNFGIKEINRKLLLEKKEEKNLRLFWLGDNRPKNENSILPKYHVICGSITNPGAENLISVEYSKAKEKIVKFLEKIGCEVEEHTLHPGERLDPSCFDGNVVLLTGETHPILGFEEFVESVKLPYFYKKNDQGVMSLFRRVRNFSGNQIEYRQASVLDKDHNICLAFGTLTRFANDNTEQVMIILNGGHGFGVSAPAYFLTSSDTRKTSNLGYLNFYRLNKEAPSYQIVLEVNNSKKQSKPDLTSRDLHLSTWIRLEVGDHQLRSAVADLCTDQLTANSRIT
jgi:hypothetical protein